MRESLLQLLAVVTEEIVVCAAVIALPTPQGGTHFRH